MKKQTGKIAVLSILTFAVVMLTGCRSMFGSKEEKPQYVNYDFSQTGEVESGYKLKEKNNPVQVIMFAKSLSAAGRYKDGANIYLDAADRFSSKNGHFEFDCRMAAVRELWLAGDLEGAAEQLNELESYQDVYMKASEAESIRKLRQLLIASKVIKVNAQVRMSENNTTIGG